MIQRLAPLDKRKEFSVIQSSYRPLCMLDCTGKVLIRAAYPNESQGVGQIRDWPQITNLVSVRTECAPSVSSTGVYL